VTSHVPLSDRTLEMADISDKEFFTSVISAGAILTGFAGTFLQFRIQREANYYRQPALSYEKSDAVDVYIGKSHFTSSFLLIMVATILALISGFTLPLLALADVLSFATPKMVSSGLLASLVFLVGYFCAEMVHYGILNTSLLNDPDEWGREWKIVIATLIIAVLSGTAVFVS
jgi:hypothetical protein